jgi:iron complex outermembrane receptor protein
MNGAWRMVFVPLSVVLGLAGPRRVAAQQQTVAAEQSLDSLLNTHISAASKYAQTSAEAPASVTLVTSDEIKQFGYRNLQELLENVPGFYVSNDRNYAYLGARGFSRPTDYNDRILLLIDGHTMNDQTWGGANIGSELALDLSIIERVEIVRGPGSALYGTNAMFAVINIVTKSGATLDGAHVSARLGTGGTRQAAVAAGRPLGMRGAFTVSGFVSRSDGGDIFFKEFDSPQTNFGVAHGLDWERSESLLGSFTWADVSVRAGYTSRAKGIPTASFGATFNDPRYQTTDESLWGEIQARRDVSASVHLNGRLYADRYRYSGIEPVGPGPVYADGGGSTDAGAEGMMTWEPSSRSRVTIGSEFRHVSRANYYEYLPDGTYSHDDSPYDLASVYAQAEWQARPWLNLVGGARYDGRSDGHAGAAPRAAIVITPDSLTTIKLLYGEGFRAPSIAEANLTTSFYSRNPSLRNERISAFELDVQRRALHWHWLQYGVALYRYEFDDLIDQVAIDTSGSLQFRNVEASHGSGAELTLDALPRGPIAARIAYAWQVAENDSTGTRLTNSPDQIATLSLTAHPWASLRSALIVRHESGRLTLAGTWTAPFTRTDFNVVWSPGERTAWHGAELSARVTNLFNNAYFVPGGVEHVQAAIVQEGRAILVRLDLHF